MDEQQLQPCFACRTPDGGRWRTFCPWCSGAGVIDVAARRAQRERIREHMKAAGYTLGATCVVDLSGATVGTTGTIDLIDLRNMATGADAGGGQ